MTEVAPIVQVVTSLIVGLGSGVVGAKATERSVRRRYEREREDTRLPLIRELATLYRWEGEHLIGERSNGAPDDRFKEAVTAFDLHRHDLPIALQEELDDDSRVDPDDTYSIGEHYLALSEQLLAYHKQCVLQRQRPRRRRRTQEHGGQGSSPE